ncbi:Protein ORF73 [Lentibacillus sp. JNUCC-1]|uniref:amyloid fiber anchoring/assembly protein TapA n=1 Tax=Lentibacillus sp. JNUCC-1 TaxID=2654513 RepID=UPI001321FE7F|nr:amyloid fiber anchoring/assembly protein TapA [Lentibacillus sp. JNUCC-1]MUV38594.1 Protein ORF73 [Lentibacillus sp. JNUCC-1]
MRSKRVIKFGKKNRLLIILMKTSFIFYLVLFTAGYMISSTTAHFSSTTQISQQVATGTWSIWDGSDLAFTEVIDQAEVSCPAEITTVISNKGEGAMEDTSLYEVYYSETGNPQEDGAAVALNAGEGIIDVLEAGEMAELTYETDQPGFYQFVIHQREDHPRDAQVWSEKIEVICETEPEPEEEEPPATETDKQENETDEEPEKAKQKEKQPEQPEAEGETDHSEEIEGEPEKKQKTKETNSEQDSAKDEAKKEKPSNDDKKREQKSPGTKSDQSEQTEEPAGVKEEEPS